MDILKEFEKEFEHYFILTKSFNNIKSFIEKALETQKKEYEKIIEEMIGGEHKFEPSYAIPVETHIIREDMEKVLERSENIGYNLHKQHCIEINKK